MHYHIHIACLIALFLSMLIFLDDLHEDFILIDLKEIDLNFDSTVKEEAYVPISESLKQRLCEFNVDNKSNCLKEKKQLDACMEEIGLKVGKGGGGVVGGVEGRGGEGGRGELEEELRGRGAKELGEEEDVGKVEREDEGAVQVEESENLGEGERVKEIEKGKEGLEEEKLVMNIQNYSFFTKSSQNWIVKSLEKEKFLKLFVLENNFLGQNKSKTRIYLFKICYIHYSFLERCFPKKFYFTFP